jgi:hypothetical protein
MTKIRPSEISLELRKEYCARQLKTLLRYATPSELDNIAHVIESQIAVVLADRYCPGLNDASYSVYRSYWLKGGAV